MQESNTIRRLDSVGAFLSFGCALHCIALPLLLIVAPTIGSSLVEGDAHHLFDSWMFVITIGLATVSLCWGSRIHGQFRTIPLLGAAVLLFWLGGFHVHDIRDGIFVALGGLCLTAAHLLNRRLCQSCTRCAHA